MSGLNLKKAEKHEFTISSKKTRLTKFVSDPASYYSRSKMGEVDRLAKSFGTWLDQKNKDHFQGTVLQLAASEKLEDEYVAIQLLHIENDVLGNYSATEAEKEAFENAKAKMPRIIKDRLRIAKSRMMFIFGKKELNSLIKGSEGEVSENVQQLQEEMEESKTALPSVPTGPGEQETETETVPANA